MNGKLKSATKNALAILLLNFCNSGGIHADLFYNDDVIVKGSICIGVDCVNGETFSFDTIRLKENNLRIKFTDTSAASGFPSADWELVANESANGGANYFAIRDDSSDTIPFKVLYGNRNNAFYMHSNGFIGINTSTPGAHMHISHGNSPSVRLDQDGSSGFSAQAWDVAGNETNFFVRDVTNGGTLPFRIRAGAPAASIYVDADGDIGFETTSPDGIFDIAHPTNVNNHAVLVTNSALFGINIDNSFVPRGLFDVQTTNGTSRFTVQSDGKVGIGLGSASTANGLFDVQISGVSKFLVDNEGDVGIGTATPTGRFEIKSTDGATSYVAVDTTGQVGIGTNTPTTGVDFTRSQANVLIKDSDDSASTADVRTLMTLNSKYGSNIKFTSRENSGKDWTIGTYSTSNGFMFTRQDVSDGNADPHDNYILLLNDGLMSYQDISGTELLRLSITGLTINGTFASASSRTFKENITPVDSDSILEKLAGLSISTWNYLSDDSKSVHMGPIAEDFFQVFGLGNDEKHITTTDISGVTLAAVQALHRDLNERSQEIERLKKQNQELQQRLEAIEAALSSSSDTATQ